MKNLISKIVVLTMLCGVCSNVVTVYAQGTQSSQSAPKSQMAAADTAAPTSFRAEFMKVLDDSEKKFLSLAEAIPQDKYAWRPMDGVRSVSEVYMHMTMSNFRFPSFLNIKAPMTIEPSMEKIADKAKVIELMKQSFQHVRQAATNTPEAEWDKTVMFNNRNAVVRDRFFQQALGWREHLGQSIAYARTNRVVPPWTAEREAQQRKP